MNLTYAIFSKWTISNYFFYWKRKWAINIKTKWKHETSYVLKEFVTGSSESPYRRLIGVTDDQESVLQRKKSPNEGTYNTYIDQQILARGRN